MNTVETKIESLLESWFIELEEAEHKWGISRNKPLARNIEKVIGKNPITDKIRANRSSMASTASGVRSFRDKQMPKNNVYDNSVRKNQRKQAGDASLRHPDNISPLKKGLQKISRLIEEATFQEIRYLIEAPQFDTLKNKNKIDFRDDYYFDEYRIRHIVQKGPNINSDLWQKISTKQSGLVEKKKEKLPPQNIIDLDKKANCRLHVVSKRPVYEGVELYLEKVQVYKKGKQIKEFITTETESPKDTEELKYLKQVPGIVSVKQVPEKSLRALAKRIIE